MLRTILEREELFIKGVVFVDYKIKPVLRLTPENVRVMQRLEGSRVCFRNRDPFPQRLGCIALQIISDVC